MLEDPRDFSGHFGCFLGENGRILGQKREKRGTFPRFSRYFLRHGIRFYLCFQWVSSTVSQFHSREGVGGYRLDTRPFSPFELIVERIKCEAASEEHT